MKTPPNCFLGLPPEQQQVLWELHEDLTTDIGLAIKRRLEALPPGLDVRDILSSVTGTMTTFVSGMLQGNGLDEKQVAQFFAMASKCVIPMRKGELGRDVYAHYKQKGDGT